MSNKKKILFSFIIPTFNEEGNLPSTVSSIRQALKGFNYEIIIVDNGSYDNTRALAENLADRVYLNDKANVGELRNIGASHAEGEFLVFNDADVTLQPEWLQAALGVLDTMRSQNIVAGGSLETPGDQEGIHRFWFRPLLENKWKSSLNYVGSANMIVKKEFFDECSGFDPSLTSGEDSDFCKRAKSNGASILLRRDLKAVHLGYPSTLKAFFKRELWHGEGDYESVSNFVRSRTALLSLGMFFFHILVFISFFSGQPKLVIVGVFLLTLFPIGFSLLKFRCPLGFPDRFRNVFLSYVYLFARSISWVPKVL